MKYIIEICVAIDIAILGIAYPILIDKISNIGQKYNSEYLPNVFDSEFPNNKVIRKISFFQFVLILTLLSFIFQIFSFQPIDIFKENFFVENSADILLFSLTLILTISFFYWLNLIMLYQGKASELLNYLIEKYGNQKEENQSKTYLLKSINEFTIYAIEKQDPHLQPKLLDFYSSLFYSYRENNTEEDGTLYHIDLYNVTNEIITASIDNKNKKLKALEHRASSGTWLIGENFKFNKISKSTYSWIWRNLVTSSNQKNLVTNYWPSVSQYFNYSLSGVQPEYSDQGITNQVEIDKVKKERNRFLELNFALGGLLIYQNENDTIKYILSFSQSQPPSYPLLPQTMDDIFYWFNHFSNEFKTRDEPIEYKYYFPEIDNLGISRNVSHNICLYISLLFIRQFTQQTIYVYQNFKIFHNLTNDLQDLYSYNDRLPYFKNCIEKVISDTELLNTLGYNFDSEEILRTFDELGDEIKERIDVTKLTANLSLDKIETFNDSTKRIITSSFNEYNSIENHIKFENIDESIVSSINGELIVSSKSSFTDNDIPNINFDKVYSQHIATNKIKYFLPNTFLLAKTDRYLIERKQLLEGIDRIAKNIKNKLIIAIRPSYYTKEIISNSKYKDIIFVIPSSNHHLNDAFFILDKEHLPMFEYKDLPKKEKEKFSLKQLDKNYKLYSNIIDVNLPENVTLKEEYITNDDKELKVLILISFIFLIKWRKDRKITMLSLTSPYEEKGIINDIEDLKPIKPAANKV
ncbi:hypothetical protein [uncultured Tenacibaculum sp.]|uniref:hypothetical protein n=1 Tax=uncultured Tenacibaculum sp. TaxID=174713 RepID=UPI00260418FD|nr:hypothetical protein [uncultured Tenacibaculum sp.]